MSAEVRLLVRPGEDREPQRNDGKAMKRITLQGIQRRGWANLKTKNWWMRQQVRIWSQEHHAWWRQNAMGYTVKDEEAGLFDFDDAYDRTKHCGPKKRIIFYAAVTTAKPHATMDKHR